MVHPEGFHIHPRIRTKIWIYITVFFLTLILSVIHNVNGNLSFYFPLGGFLAGMILGVLVSRINTFIWDDEQKKLISRMDATGLTILILYVVFLILKKTIIQSLVHVHDISSISLAIVAGVMLGRSLIMRKRIYRILFKENF